MAETVTVGAGPDSLVLGVSQDAYKGDAQYVVRVDGAQIGGVLTAQASYAPGERDTVTVRGDWGPGRHTVEVEFVNDLWEPGAGDRNLYVTSASYNGTEIPAPGPGHIAQRGFTAFAEPGEPVPAAAGLAAAAPGYRVVLSDDFSAGYNLSNWGPPFPLPWPPGWSSNGMWLWTGDETNVRDGEMQVTMTRHDGAPWTAGGFNSFRAGVSIHYGTVEFDARVEEAQGTMAAILMWPASDKWTSEIDILETPWDEVLHTLHWQDEGGGHQYSPIWHNGFDETQWNHFKLTWLPGLVRIEVNGRVHAEWTSNVPDEPMGFGAMGYVVAPHEGWAGGPPDATTPPVVTLHLDNVLMSQWTGIGG